MRRSTLFLLLEDNMLTTEQIEQNKQEFIALVRSITRDGADIDRLINKLENSDFFYAPASTKYHAAYDGGLCEHSLNVYHNLVKLITNTPGLDGYCYDENSIKIIALLHDISKMNIYERTSKNTKVYCSPQEGGNKRDEMGTFKWVSEPGWKTRDRKFVYGNHEMTSEYIIRQFIPLTIDESVAVLHHMGGMAWDSAQNNIGDIFNQYQLALMLYMADMLSSYVNERISE